MKQMRVNVSVIFFMTTILILPAIALAGDMNPPENPGSTIHTPDESDNAIANGFGGLSSVARTGQETSYNTAGTVIRSPGTGQVGDRQKDVALPIPRFADNLDGTVTDNLTGLIWLKNANRFGTSTWRQALTDCNNLADDGSLLTDGSSAGDWRLPSVKELQSLTDFAYYKPSLPNTTGTGQWIERDPFTYVQFATSYWSSTAYADRSSYAWYVSMLDGYVSFVSKASTYYVWPVRSDN